MTTELSVNTDAIEQVLQFAEAHPEIHYQPVYFSIEYEGYQVEVFRQGGDVLPGTMCLSAMTVLLFAPEGTTIYGPFIRLPGTETQTAVFTWAKDYLGLTPDQARHIFTVSSNKVAIDRLRLVKEEPEISGKHLVLSVPEFP